MLENENYPGALQAIQDEIKSGLQEKTLTEEYVASLNGTIFQGEAMQKKGSFAVAGKLFQNALVAFPRDTELTSRAALVPEQLMANIDICAQELMDDGLIAYRAGNLNQAIDIWKQILSFHPQFGPAKTATETAERQLENLRSMDEGKDQDGQK